MYYVFEEIIVRRVRYGFILKMGILLFVITFFLCTINYLINDFNIHTEEIMEDAVMVSSTSSYADITVTAMPNYPSN